jgi:hypothetical protein
MQKWSRSALYTAEAATRAPCCKLLTTQMANGIEHGAITSALPDYTCIVSMRVKRGCFASTLMLTDANNGARLCCFNTCTQVSVLLKMLIGEAQGVSSAVIALDSRMQQQQHKCTH